MRNLKGAGIRFPYTATPLNVPIRVIIVLMPNSLGLAQKITTPMKTGYAPVNGVKLYYEIWGSGEPLILIHRIVVGITMFGPNPEVLSEKRRSSRSNYKVMDTPPISTGPIQLRGNDRWRRRTAQVSWNQGEQPDGSNWARRAFRRGLDNKEGTALSELNWEQMDARKHWEKIYTTKAPDTVSWFRPHLEISIALIEKAAPDHSASIIDVGGGESTLADDLLARGYQNLTVLDISMTALQVTRERLGPAAGQIRWLAADITQPGVLPDSYDVWHDRAVFHFLTERKDRLAYVQNVVTGVKRGGHVIVSTFGPAGPATCSGLSVMRYDPGSLHGEFGARFRLVESSKELHTTPFGTTQQFLYCYCRVC